MLDIPVPPSVNRARKVNWAAIPEVEAWHRQCHLELMASGQHKRATKFAGPFELDITLDEQQCQKDPDNIVKHACDYLRRVDLIRDDSPKYFRRLLVQWGDAPKGCRLQLSPPRTALERIKELLPQLTEIECRGLAGAISVSEA